MGPEFTIASLKTDRNRVKILEKIEFLVNLIVTVRQITAESDSKYDCFRRIIVDLWESEQLTWASPRGLVS